MLLFGLPLALAQADAEEVERTLSAVWTSMLGRPPMSLHADIEELRRWFDPLARGERLRRELDAIEKTSVHATRLSLDELLVSVAKQRMIVTPEGRIVIEVLRMKLAESTPVVVIDEGDLLSAEHTVANAYRAWSRKKLTSVIALREGRAGVLRPPAAGFALFLLVNRSTAPERAIHRLDDARARSAADEAIGSVVEAFADRLKAGRRKTEHFSTYGGYAISELRRRIRLGSESDEIYVPPGTEEDVLEFVAADLMRRPRTSPGAILSAFDALVSRYRSVHSTLASLGLAHERPADTARLRERLENLTDLPGSEHA